MTRLEVAYSRAAALIGAEKAECLEVVEEVERISLSWRPSVFALFCSPSLTFGPPSMKVGAVSRSRTALKRGLLASSTVSAAANLNWCSRRSCQIMAHLNFGRYSTMRSMAQTFLTRDC